jgi:prefoldin subunit 5
VDAVTVAQQAAEGSPAMTAMLVALALAMMEVIKTLVGWLGKKLPGAKDKRQTLLVQLDPEVSQIVHETGDHVKGVSAIVSRVDADGVPLVYADRKMERSVEKIANVLERISQSQDKIQENMAKLEHRFEMHDRSDAVTFARMADSQERLEEIGANNRDSILEIKQDNRRVVDSLQEIKLKIAK